MDVNVTKVDNVPEKLNLDLSATRRKAITVDGDENRVLYINLSDMGVLSRAEEVEDRMAEISGIAGSLQDAEKDTAKAAETLKKLDAEMRKLIDYIFDANVSEVCAPDGTMFDPFNGLTRWEIIIDALSGLLGENLGREIGAMNKRIKKHTGKYTGKK